MSYQIIFAEEAEMHLGFLTIRDQRIAIAAIEEQLLYQPNIATKNRQLMRPNPVATWKLRVGNLRIYYDIDEEPQVVRILAIGVKDRNRVRIGNRYLEL